MFCNATDIYNLLIADDLTQSQGEIQFNFLDISIKINEKSAIGDLFQEWFAQWLRSKGIFFKMKPNTQEFPDFLLNPTSETLDLLEVKTFDFNRSANFDVANFEAYCRSLKTQSYRLDSDYFIFAYQLLNYQFQIRQVWLKKIWEITGSSERYPVKCQVKQEVIFNIRPISWYSTRSKFQAFKTRREFVEALAETLKQYPKTRLESEDWLHQVQKNYFDYTGQSL